MGIIRKQMNNRIPPRGDEGRQSAPPYHRPYYYPNGPLRQWSYDGPNVWYPNEPGSFFYDPNQGESVPNQGNQQASRFEPPKPFYAGSQPAPPAQPFHVPNAAPRYPTSSYTRPSTSQGTRRHADPVAPPPPPVCCRRHVVDTNTDPIERPVATNPPLLEPPPSPLQASKPPKKHHRIPIAELEASKHSRLVPDLEIFDSFKDALHHTKLSFGGVLRQVTSKKQAKGNHCWTYKCKHEDEEGHQCPLTIFIKRHGPEKKTKGFSVWMGEPLKDDIPRDMHDHLVDRFEEIGVPLQIRAIVDAMIADEDVKPNEVMSKIKRFLIDDLPSDDSLKKIAQEDHLWENLHQQVQNYIKYKKRSKAKDYTPRTVMDVVELCERHSFDIPLTYVPRSNYESAEELATALGIDDVDKMLLIHLGSGPMLVELLTYVKEENKGLSKREMSELVKKAKSQVRVAIIACSPFMLFRLLQLSKLPAGLRSIYRDGTHGTLLCGSKLVTHLVTGDIRLRKSQNQVTSKNAAAFYLITPEEYKHSTMASDIWAKNICKSLFGADLELDWAISDMALGFLTGVTSVWKKLRSILNCNFHVQQKIGPGNNSELKKKCRTGHQKTHAPRNWNNAQHAKSEALFSCATRLFIQDLDDEGPYQEKAASNYLNKYYLTKLTRNWYYMAAGTFRFYLRSVKKQLYLLTYLLFVIVICVLTQAFQVSTHVRTFANVIIFC
jgi:hypothetical protein